MPEQRDINRLLIEKGLISKEQFKTAYKIHSEKGGLLSELLIKLGYVDEKEIGRAHV